MNVNRINILFYAHALFIVLGAAALIRFRPVTGLPVLACYGLAAVLFLSSYFGPWAQQIRVQFYEDFLQAVSFAGEREDAALVITPDVQYAGGRAVSEILTMYALDIDAEYYQGKGSGPLPYRERFAYRNLTAADFSEPRAGTRYVIKTDTLPPELPAGWTAVDFDSYTVLYYGA